MPTIITGVASDETVSVKWVPTITDVNAPKLSTEINAATAVTLECLIFGGAENLVGQHGRFMRPAPRRVKMNLGAHGFVD